MIYLDTSVLGALFFRESTAPAVLARLESAGAGELCASALTLTEMASVGAIKERTGSVNAASRMEGLAACNRFVSDSLTLVEAEAGDFRTAAKLLDAPALSLRAGDALHLALACRIRASLATLDKRQAGAANHYGVEAFPVAD
jgi:predicted nucleic acid-binding protein